MLDTSELVKTTRDKLNLSQEDFGRIIGTSRFSVWAWESKKNKPTKYMLELILSISKIKTPPSKEKLKDALIVEGSAFALFLILNEIFNETK